MFKPLNLRFMLKISYAGCYDLSPVIFAQSTTFSRQYLSNGRAVGMVVVVCLSVRPFVINVLRLSFRAQGKTFHRNN